MPAKPVTPPAPRAHSVPDAARVLGVCATSVWGLIRAGEIRPVRLGRRTIIPVSELERLLSPSRG